VKPSGRAATEEATCGRLLRAGTAGRNLCGHSAAGLVGLGFGCGGHEASFLGGGIGLLPISVGGPSVRATAPEKDSGGRRRFSGASKREADWRHGGHEGGHGRTVHASRCDSSALTGLFGKGGWPGFAGEQATRDQGVPTAGGRVFRTGTFSRLVLRGVAAA
jgi:hypothetical protein